MNPLHSSPRANAHQRPATVVEHTIVYAYPHSDSARRAGFATCGAYCLKVGTSITGFAGYGAALDAVAGTTPSRWSMDHAANARFLTPEQAALSNPAGSAS